MTEWGGSFFQIALIYPYGPLDFSVHSETLRVGYVSDKSLQPCHQIHRRPAKNRWLRASEAFGDLSRPELSDLADFPRIEAQRAGIGPPQMSETGP
jgi:hypothetical protein